MRCFVAVVPPQEVVEEIDAFWEPRREAASWRWTSPEQFHLTLAFLPRVEEYQLDELIERLAAAAARRGPLRLRISGGGAFPSVDRAKVLWAGVASASLDGSSGGGEAAGDGAAELTRLATGARHAAAATGIEVGGARFRPHLTLARIAHPEEVTRWLRVAETFTSAAFDVDEIALVASHLGEGPRRRPRYERLADLPVGGG
ncbi:RNA 2',3'-cyclic phosphodiesterase [Nocardioides dubius]|uniref:RNA 2',3'-cyclic phosphodiesterase n=2 Tax=Nocardioides dubius TaxID=317019 RepID=A0ABN1TVB5_9ACTN